MRLGVLDVGSNTVHLQVCDAVGGAPLPVHRHRVRLRLAETLDATGRLDEVSVSRLVEAVSAARATARRWGVDELLGYATAVVRDAPNRCAVLEAVREGAGAELAVLPGETEAELTFLAARRWMGWRIGSMTLFDIGGGSLEVAFGRGSHPDFRACLPLGAGRLTREHFAAQDPPERGGVRALRRHVRGELQEVAARLRWEGTGAAVGTSRTFQQLARLCGAAPARRGPFVARRLARSDLRAAVRRLAGLTASQRAALPGISAARARQSLAGAVVAHTLMRSMGVDEVTVCPWALREGVLLRRIEGGDPAWWPDLCRAPRGGALATNG
ncbi:Ppx/GppA phosphatase family protein [Streptomyces sp. URMC 123]|uniref:Ppx/GppA phosphatase family protein n=1 Tax=Streptomyces sp. URMC 123 TaxID=3423403 RepID=UPI003F19C208